MKHGARDYWSFVEKIQDATDYVQGLLTENSRLRRRMTDLEREKEELAQELDQLRQIRPKNPKPAASDPWPSPAVGQKTVLADSDGLLPDSSLGSRTLQVV